jgi:hypothetical protein
MRQESAVVLGILLAGLFQIEQEAARPQPEPVAPTTPSPQPAESEASGVWHVGRGVRLDGL